MFSCIGRNLSSAVIDIGLGYARATLSTVRTAHYEHVIDKASTDNLIRELVFVREGLFVLSDSRISKDDVCAAREHLCVVTL